MAWLFVFDPKTWEYCKFKARLGYIVRPYVTEYSKQESICDPVLPKTVLLTLKCENNLKMIIWCMVANFD